MCLESPCLGTLWEGEIREYVCLVLSLPISLLIKFLPTKNLLHYWVLPLGHIGGLLHCQTPHPAVSLHPGGIGKRANPWLEGGAQPWSRGSQEAQYSRTRAWSVLGGGCVAQAGMRLQESEQLQGSNRTSGSFQHLRLISRLSPNLSHRSHFLSLN